MCFKVKAIFAACLLKCCHCPKDRGGWEEAVGLNCISLKLTIESKVTSLQSYPSNLWYVEYV